MIKDVEIRPTNINGRGVFSIRAFKPEELIFRARKGPILNAAEVRRLPRAERNRTTMLSKNSFELDSPPGAYVNHSCSPNGYWRGRSLFAWKRIRSGEEITVDYSIAEVLPWRFKCKCGERKCRGMIYANFFRLPKSLQKKYLSFTSREIRRQFLADNK